MGAKFGCNAEPSSLLDQLTERVDCVPSCHSLTYSLCPPFLRSSLPALFDIPQCSAVAILNWLTSPHVITKVGSTNFSPLQISRWFWGSSRPRDLQGLPGPYPSKPCRPKAQWKTPSLTLELEIVSWFMLFLPEGCMLCQHFYSTQRAANYKSYFSPVNLSQPGTSPSFSFVSEAKSQLFTQLCLAARQPFLCPSSLPQKS